MRLRWLRWAADYQLQPAAPWRKTPAQRREAKCKEYDSSFLASSDTVPGAAAQTGIHKAQWRVRFCVSGYRLNAKPKSSTLALQTSYFQHCASAPNTLLSRKRGGVGKFVK